MIFSFYVEGWRENSDKISNERVSENHVKWSEEFLGVCTLAVYPLTLSLSYSDSKVVYDVLGKFGG